MSVVSIEDVDKFTEMMGAHVKKLNTKIYIADEKLVRFHKVAKKSAEKQEELKKDNEILKKDNERLKKNKEICGGLVPSGYMLDRYGDILDERMIEMDSYDFDAFERKLEKELNI